MVNAEVLNLTDSENSESESEEEPKILTQCECDDIEYKDKLYTTLKESMHDLFLLWAFLHNHRYNLDKII